MTKRRAGKFIKMRRYEDVMVFKKYKKGSLQNCNCEIETSSNGDFCIKVSYHKQNERKTS